ncbi:NosD domain-containing protein [Natronolimnohabitans innermongolicus]|uniref:NosL family protein n=1 Tax=Natronolimnohabitans innermongolicus JCM 12255 TaxID=1227499 RepID=L9XB05_9EURY|nr:NosD domain-containing protein [Natronolimnohabitans innermongolicus]ELY58919.1 NosL family protein [Natronolimnohabitans innermongolicus JCM 12255]
MPALSTTRIALGAFVVIVLGAAGLFVVDAGSTAPDPVAFDDTVHSGITLEAERELDDDVELPQAQVFYSQYQYVVGYYGVETFAHDQQQPEHEQRFGHPLTVYVTDYSGTGVELNDDGYPTTDSAPEWTDAETAWYVLESDAETPAGTTVVPFTDRDDADAFADEHGGDVRDWEAVLEATYDRDDAAVARDRVDGHQAVADDRVEQTADLTERPTSMVVGSDAETIQEAVDEAPAETTIRVPNGTYEETVEIDRPMTIAGDGDVTIRGDGNSSVVTVTTERVAVRNVAIDGVGETTRGDGDVDIGVDDEEFGSTFMRNYVSTDAGITAYNADELLVQDVHIDTPASGILEYGTDDAAVRNATVIGPDDPSDGLGGVLLLQSNGVIEHSTFDGTPNGVYLFRSPTTVVRSNTVTNNQLGIHLMHTDDSLLADNEVHGQANTGVYIMTGPERNAIVGNTIRDTDTGLTPGGSDTYVADNRIANTSVGLRIDTASSIYEGNVIVGNEVGADVTGMLPTNRVIGNDFVGNGEHATTATGPLRIWSDEGEGNYWQGAAGVASGDYADRSYTPTDDVDKRLHTTDGTPTLVRAPALGALAGLEGTVPGMRTGSIADNYPACEPINADRLEATGWDDQAWTCYETTRTPTDD